jgi:hypothetical protein
VTGEADDAPGGTEGRGWARIREDFPLLLRGVALLAAALGAALLALRCARASAVPGLAASGPLTLVAALMAWAAAVHLTGGEKFDDHAWE